MLTIVLRLDVPDGNTIGVKEALALYLEPFGASQIVSIVESERSQTKMEAF